MNKVIVAIILLTFTACSETPFSVKKTDTTSNATNIKVDSFYVDSNINGSGGKEYEEYKRK